MLTEYYRHIRRPQLIAKLNISHSCLPNFVSATLSVSLFRLLSFYDPRVFLSFHLLYLTTGKKPIPSVFYSVSTYQQRFFVVAFKVTQRRFELRNFLDFFFSRVVGRLSAAQPILHGFAETGNFSLTVRDPTLLTPLPIDFWNWRDPIRVTINTSSFTAAVKKHLVFSLFV